MSDVAVRHSKPARLAFAALRAAQANKWETATDYVKRISDECGGEGLSVALRAWIDTYVDHATDGDHSPRAGRLAFVNTEDGKAETSDAERIPDRIRWAGQMIEARAAKDQAAWSNLVAAMPADGLEIGRYISAVLEVCVQPIGGFPRGFASPEARARWADA